jgi:hypothetical protein
MGWWKSWPVMQWRPFGEQGLQAQTLEMFRLLGGGVYGDAAGLPNSQLAVLPGTSHVALLDRADFLLSIIPAFLDTPMPGTH